MNDNEIKTNYENLTKLSEFDLINISKNQWKIQGLKVILPEVNNKFQKCSKLNLWKKPTKDFFRFCGRFGVFLTLTVGIVLILSASSGTKETVVVAGAGTQSAVVGGGDVGGRNTESLNTACPSSKALISCGKLISSELPIFKESSESISRSLSSLSGSKQAVKISCSD